MEKKKEKKNKVIAFAGYIAGSIALGAATTLVLIKGMPYISGMINKEMAKRKNSGIDDDDWGPIIEMKTAVKAEDETNDN